jgi:hypothetical protein
LWRVENRGSINYPHPKIGLKSGALHTQALLRQWQSSGEGQECCAEDDWDGLYLWLVLDPTIIIQACVDVWEEHQKKEVETDVK